MITNHTKQAAIRLTESLAGKGLAVKAKTNTLLETLCNANISATTIIAAKSPTSQISLETIVTDSKLKTIDGVNTHDVLHSEVMLKTSNILTNLFSVVRNDLIPDANEVLENYDAILENSEIVAPEPFAIIPNNYHRLWGLAQLHGFVERFKDAPLNKYRVNIKWPMLDKYDLLNMIKTGIKSLDEVIDEWVHDLPEDKLINLWRRLFVEGSASIGEPTGFNHVTTSGLDRNDILLAFLIANKLDEHIPDGVNATAEQIALEASHVLANAGRAINAELRNRERITKLGSLIYDVKLHVDKYRSDGVRTIYVNGDVYNAYLENGGLVDAIYGAVLNKGSLTMDHIVENTTNFVNQYRSFKALSEDKTRTVLFNVKKDAIRLAFTKFINDAKEDKIENKSLAHRVLGKLIDCIRVVEIDQVDIVVRNLVCDLLYSDTNAKMFLEAMDVAESTNPDISPRECALLAQIDLTARWLADQITTKKCSF